MSARVAVPQLPFIVRALGREMLASLTSGFVVGLVDGPRQARRAVAVLVVRDTSGDLRRQAGIVLREAGGRAIYDFGRFTVRTVAS